MKSIAKKVSIGNVDIIDRHIRRQRHQFCPSIDRTVLISTTNDIDSVLIHIDIDSGQEETITITIIRISPPTKKNLFRTSLYPRVCKTKLEPFSLKYPPTVTKSFAKDKRLAAHSTTAARHRRTAAFRKQPARARSTQPRTKAANEMSSLGGVPLREYRAHPRSRSRAHIELKMQTIARRTQVLRAPACFACWPALPSSSRVRNPSPDCAPAYRARATAVPCERNLKDAIITFCAGALAAA